MAKLLFSGFYSCDDDEFIEDDLVNCYSFVNMPAFNAILMVNEFSIFHLKYLSVVKKLDDFGIMVNIMAFPDLLMLPETWLTSVSCFIMQAYNSFHDIRQRDRPDGDVSI